MAKTSILSIYENASEQSPKKVGFELVGWIQLAEHIDRFQALASTVMNSDSVG